MLAPLPFSETYNIAAITNDIFTREDGEFLVRSSEEKHENRMVQPGAQRGRR